MSVSLGFVACSEGLKKGISFYISCNMSKLATYTCCFGYQDLLLAATV